MARLVKPKTYLVGKTVPRIGGINSYLADTGQLDFGDDIEQYVVGTAERPYSAGYETPGEVLISMMAKLCYSSLVPGRNANLTKTRDIQSNVKATIEAGHGSVLEHISAVFITTNCSRVFTHELIRHRVGTAFSQTSGRYVRLDSVDFVCPPELEPHSRDVLDFLDRTENQYELLCKKVGIGLEGLKFEVKKRLTSALRRILPDGRANEIGWTANLRTIRHLLMLRTSRHAEWEIRYVFNQVWLLVKEEWPDVFEDARVEEVDGLLEITGMRTQPYEA